MSAPLVSVIVPVHNGAARLRETLRSIAEQSLREVEVLCVDDGSTDDTPTVLLEFARGDSRFRVLHQENQGPGPARNAGLAEAGGKYLAFLDADDIYEPDFLEVMVQKAESTGADVAVCAPDAFDDGTGKILTDWSCLRREALGGREAFAPQELGRELFCFTKGWPWDKLFRAEFIREKDLDYPPLPNSQDLVFVFSALALAKTVSVVDKPLVHHRVNRGASVSNSRGSSRETMNAPWDAFGLCRQRLKDHGAWPWPEEAYLRWAMGFFIWHMSTLPEDAQRVCYQKLKTDWFPRIGFERCPLACYDRSDYLKYKLIRSLPYGAYHLVRKLAGRG